MFFSNMDKEMCLPWQAEAISDMQWVICGSTNFEAAFYLQQSIRKGREHEDISEQLKLPLSLPPTYSRRDCSSGT
jgi:hypothetical protein